MSLFAKLFKKRVIRIVRGRDAFLYIGRLLRDATAEVYEGQHKTNHTQRLNGEYTKRTQPSFNRKHTTYYHILRDTLWEMWRSDHRVISGDWVSVCLIRAAEKDANLYTKWYER